MFGHLEHLALNLVEQRGYVLFRSEIKYFLDDIVTKHVLHDSTGVILDLLEDIYIDKWNLLTVSFLWSSIFVYILNKPRPNLILRYLRDMPFHIFGGYAFISFFLDALSQLEQICTLRFKWHSTINLTGGRSILCTGRSTTILCVAQIA